MLERAVAEAHDEAQPWHTVRVDDQSTDTPSVVILPVQGHGAAVQKEEEDEGVKTSSRSPRNDDVLAETIATHISPKAPQARVVVAPRSTAYGRWDATASTNSTTAKPRDSTGKRARDVANEPLRRIVRRGVEANAEIRPAMLRRQIADTNSVVAVITCTNEHDEVDTAESGLNDPRSITTPTADDAITTPTADAVSVRSSATPSSGSASKPGADDTTDVVELKLQVQNLVRFVHSSSATLERRIDHLSSAVRASEQAQRILQTQLDQLRASYHTVQHENVELREKIIQLQTEHPHRAPLGLTGHAEATSGSSARTTTVATTEHATIEGGDLATLANTTKHVVLALIDRMKLLERVVEAADISLRRHDERLEACDRKMDVLSCSVGTTMKTVRHLKAKLADEITQRVALRQAVETDREVRDKLMVQTKHLEDLVHQSTIEVIALQQQVCAVAGRTTECTAHQDAVVEKARARDQRASSKRMESIQCECRDAVRVVQERVQTLVEMVLQSRNEIVACQSTVHRLHDVEAAQANDRENCLTQHLSVLSAFRVILENQPPQPCSPRS